MRGSIIKRSENSYTIVLNLGKDPATGKRRQQWVTVKGNKRDAEKRLSELLHQLDTNTFVKPGRMTVAEYLEQWLWDTALPNMSPRTYEGYEYAVKKHILPALGQIHLTQLKPQHLQRLYSEKQLANKNRTCEYIHFTLRKSLQDAVKMGILVRNPTEAVERPKVSRREMHTMNESDIHLFLEYARATPYYVLFYILLFTGVRRSEALALRWSDVDLLLCQLSVSRSVHLLRYGA